MRTGLRFFYRHIYITGLEHIPSKGPAIIIANHPSSLMDAALLGILLKRKPWFFTRGDVFINKPVQKILSWLHMIPVHPHEKGRSTISANDNSFTAAQEILANNGIIVFFPESTSHVQHQLWPFRKGVFRLAFQTMAAHDFSFQLPIVPIGITYDHPTAGRKCVQAHAGPPLQTADYIALYQSNPSAALLHILKDAQNSMTALVLHVLRSERCPIAEQQLLMNSNNQQVHSPAWKIASRQKLEQEQHICHAVNKASETALAAIKKKNTAYFEALERYGLEDKTLSASFSSGCWGRFLLWIGFPVYVVGWLLNGWPVFIARRVADKNVRRIDFYSWIFVAGYCILYFLWFLLAAAAAVYYTGWYSIAVIALMGLTGLFSYSYIDLRRAAKQYRRLKRLSVQELDELRKMRL